MFLILKKQTNPATLQGVCDHLRQLELEIELLETADHKVIAVLSDISSLPTHVFSQLNGVEKVVRPAGRHPLASSASRDLKPGDSDCWKAFATGKTPVIIAGPCSVESEIQILDLAQKVKLGGATMLRGGAFKPRTSPYDFPGLGKVALEYLASAREATGLPIVSEVLSAEQIEVSEPYVDVFQVGTRNMYNYELLKEIGKTRKPILLKRAMSATIDEFMQAAEYIFLEGNNKVILCERGIRTFETKTRYTLDLNAVAVLKTMCDLPVLVDPSHGTGRRDLVKPLSRAAIACGADGLILEVHATPERSISDPGQAITPETLREIVSEVNAVHQAVADRTTLLNALTR